MEIVGLYIKTVSIQISNMLYAFVKEYPTDYVGDLLEISPTAFQQDCITIQESVYSHLSLYYLR